MKLLKRGLRRADNGCVTTIRTTCPRCGEVDMGPDDICLRLDEEASEGVYSFECPSCTGPVSKQADRKIVALLVSAGVCVTHAGRRMPGGSQANIEPSSVDDPPDVPAFTVDDLIAFHEMLADDSFLSRLVAER